MNKSPRHTIALLAICLYALALVSPSDSSASSTRGQASDDWCGNTSSDWICRWRGSVLAADRQGPIQMLPPRRARQVGPEGTRVITGPNAVARVGFGNRARCTLGGNGEFGEFFARRAEEVLFRQVLGFSSCSSLKGPAEAGILCSSEEKCPATLRSTGTFFVKNLAPEASASLTEIFVRRARIVVCAGFVRVWAQNEFGYAEARGRVTGENRFVILVEESSKRTEDETPEGGIFNATEDSLSVSAVGRIPGRGGCAESFVEEQEHTVIP